MRRAIGILITLLLLMVGFHATASLALNYKKSAEEVAARVLPGIVQIGLAEGSYTVNTVGTGVVVSSNGYVLTAKHNLSGSQHVFVRLMDGTAYKATYYVADAHRDLALVKISAINLSTVKIGNSTDVRVGQEVLTFGFPASHFIKGTDTSASVAKGIVSGIERELQEFVRPVGEMEDTSEPTEMSWGMFRGIELSFENEPQLFIRHLIQIDAMMNPGSSGGAVTDTEGRIIGVCHSLISNTGANAGINFAIGINEAETILQAVGIKIGGEANASEEGGTTTTTPD